MIDLSSLDIVTNSNIYTDIMMEKIEEDGLMSERIFGPLKNYRCSCGHYSSKTQYGGKRCPKCLVLCDSNELRYKTFAKIILPLPIYKPTYKNKSKLRSLVGNNGKHLLDPVQSDLSRTTRNYLKYSQKGDKLSLVDTYDPECCIPLRISGTYTLYIAILSCAHIFRSLKAKNFIEKIFSYNILVTPPGTRHYFVKNKDGVQNTTKHPLNDIYSEILKLCSYDWTYIMDPNKNEKIYLDMIQNTLYSPIEIIDDNLQFYDQIICKYQYHTERIYSNIVDSLSGKEGYIRKDFLGRSVDFSSRSHIICDPSLQGYEIKMPKENFMRLWFIEFMKFMIDYKNVSYDELRHFIKITENNILQKYPEHIDDFIEYIFSEKLNYRNRLVLVNRQPTLWRYGIPAVLVIGVNDNDCISVSPLLLECLNSDFDGDTKAIYRIHDTQSQEELEEKAFYMNLIKYDHNPGFIQTIRLEAVFASYTLLSSQIDMNLQQINIQQIEDLPEIFESLFEVNVPVLFEDKLYSYGVVLFNKWCNFKTILIDKFTNANNISEKLYNNSINNRDYHQALSILSKKLFWYSSVNYNSPLTLSLDEIASLNVSEHKYLLSQLPKSPYIGQHLYKGLIKRLYNDIPDGHFFSKLIKSKVGKVNTQLARMIGAIGYISNDMNIIDSEPLVDSVLNGLSPDPFFRTAIGSRKGLVDKTRATPESGYLERSLVVNLSPIELGSNDCHTNIGFNITITSEKLANSLVNRYYDDNGIWKMFRKEDVPNFINQTLNFRSPITCQEPNFKICKKCFGNYYINTPYVGILSGQYISERMTQLSMRTFHTSGSCELQVDDQIVDFCYKYLKDIIHFEQSSQIIFNKIIPEELMYIFRDIPGYYDKINDYTLEYGNVYNVENEDVTKIIRNINDILKSEKGKYIKSITTVYDEYISNVLQVGDIYSVFVEIVLCNMYVTKDNEILRYALAKDINAKPYRKLNVRRLHTVVSKLLGLLYEPNGMSVCKFSDTHDNLKESQNTILERLWTGRF